MYDGRCTFNTTIWFKFHLESAFSLFSFDDFWLNHTFASIVLATPIALVKWNMKKVNFICVCMLRKKKKWLPLLMAFFCNHSVKRKSGLSLECRKPYLPTHSWWLNFICICHSHTIYCLTAISLTIHIFGHSVVGCEFSKCLQ